MVTMRNEVMPAFPVLDARHGRYDTAHVQLAEDQCEGAFTIYFPIHASEHPCYLQMNILALLIPPVGLLLATIFALCQTPVQKQLGRCLFWRSLTIPALLSFSLALVQFLAHFVSTF